MLNKHGTTKIICLTNIGHYYEKVQLVKLCKLLHLDNKTSLSRNIYVYCYRAMQKDVKKWWQSQGREFKLQEAKRKSNLGKTGHLPKLKGIICNKIWLD